MLERFAMRPAVRPAIQTLFSKHLFCIPRLCILLLFNTAVFNTRVARVSATRVYMASDMTVRCVNTQALYYQLRTFLLATRENAMQAVKDSKARQAAAAAKAAAARSAAGTPQSQAAAAASPGTSGPAAATAAKVGRKPACRMLTSSFHTAFRQCFRDN